VHRRKGSWVVRIGTAACFVFSFIAAGLVSVPDIKLGSGFVYYLERFGIFLAGSFVVFTIFVWGVVRGRVPSEISRDGLKWDELADATDDAVENLQAQLDQLANDLNELANRAVLR
jgi:outer membrane murein-binding lipoprotein Lpp